MARLKQKMIDGCADVVPPEVRELADTYLKVKRSVANLREKLRGAEE